MVQRPPQDSSTDVSSGAVAKQREVRRSQQRFAQQRGQVQADTLEQMRQSSTSTTPTASTPQERGEQAVSGHMPNVDSDDTVDKMTDQVGLYTSSESAGNQEYEVPEEVSVADQVAKAERRRRGR